MKNKYQAAITKQDGEFFALVVRVGRDGYNNVVRGYKSRFFKTLKAAERSTAKFIATC